MKLGQIYTATQILLVLLTLYQEYRITFSVDFLVIYIE